MPAQTSTQARPWGQLRFSIGDETRNLAAVPSASPSGDTQYALITDKDVTDSLIKRTAWWPQHQQSHDPASIARLELHAR